MKISNQLILITSLLIIQVSLQNNKTFTEFKKDNHCNFYSLYGSYSLSNLNSTSSNSNGTINISPTQQIFFNFCNGIKSPCSGYGNEEKGTIFYYDSLKNECILLSKDSFNENQWGFIYNDSNDETKKELYIKFNKGNTCNKTLNYQVDIEFICDNNGKEGEIKYDDDSLFPDFFSPDKCFYSLQLKSIHSCKLSYLKALLSLIDENKIIFTIIFILIGAFFCFLGSKILIASLILISFCITFIFIFSIYSLIFNLDSSTIAISWILFGISFLLGLLLSFILFKFKFIFYIAFSGLAGFTIGIILFIFGLRNINSSHIDIIFFITIGVFLVIGIVLGIYFSDKMIIISSSIVGSYIISRGLSFILSGFPSEMLIFDLLKSKNYQELDKLFTYKAYIYFSLIIIFFIIGIMIQFKFFYKKEEEEKRNMNVKNDKKSIELVNDSGLKKIDTLNWK